MVETDDRQVWKRHLDQLKEFQDRRQTTEFTSENTEFPIIPPTQELTEHEEPVEPDNIEPELNTEENSHNSSVELQAPHNTTPQYPSRNRQPPNRFM